MHKQDPLNGWIQYIRLSRILFKASSFHTKLISFFLREHTKLIVRGVVEMSGNRMESTLQVAEVGH